MKRRRYSDADRAAVLLDRLLGNSVRWIARERGIPLGTVQRWSAEFAPYCAAVWADVRARMHAGAAGESRKNRARGSEPGVSRVPKKGAAHGRAG